MTALTHILKFIIFQIDFCLVALVYAGYWLLPDLVDIDICCIDFTLTYKIKFNLILFYVLTHAYNNNNLVC